MKDKSIRFLYLLFAAVLLFFQELMAQDSLQAVKKSVFVHGSFFYDFPQSFGFSSGIDFPVSSRLKIYTGKSGEKKFSYRDVIVSVDIGFYRYRFNHSGLFFLPAVGKRYYDAGPYYFEMMLNAGLLRTFYDGLVYTVDVNGNVKEKKNFGRYYAITGASFAFGHDFERSKNSKPFALQIKPMFWIQYPYNNYVLLHVSAAIAFKYHFNRADIKVKQKNLNHKL